MIQRIQSVFLLLVAGAMTAFLLLPIWGKMNIETGELHELKALFYKSIPETGESPIFIYMPYALVGILAVASITIALTAIFKYKNRVLQMKMGALNSLIIIVTLMLYGWFVYNGQKEWMPEIAGGFGAGFFMPAIAIILNRLAIRFIKKDEDLVRSVDRIR